ncbi:hypothetical protein H2O64_22125 [Kordia sp. YSTF-M3]|uniref:Uncharacterized protein n=1 Tax=Kordia aestuariivivens TaxID=2759037 RepID=A0ABR7QFW6_9FLAO|nr:contractile injection system tape measure protein [Kordia aestuariivivens]MBC8757383.1 hypothetical protein [Kordia aestuariivivens]
MHIIHDIGFEVAVNHNDQQVSWEQYYADFLKDKLLPRVENLCDDWSKKHPNTKCTIDSIDVNVEVDGLNLEELQKEIIQQINRQFISIQSDGSTNDGNIKAVLTRKMAAFDALRMYLSNGILPAEVPIKTFKEWLSTITEFNSTEKEALNTLFAESTDTIERMLSLLRNDYTAFSGLINTKQQITSQYVKLEASFFKQFLKAVCNGFHLEYTDENANIWYRTLETSNSVTQFSKTFLLLLAPKIQAEGKRLTNSNERYLSIAFLQAIVQYELGKVLTIPVSKIGTVVNDANSIKENEAKNNLATKKTSKTATSETEKTASEAKIRKDKTDHTVSKVEKSTDQEQHQTNEKVVGNNEKEVQQTTTEIASIQGKTTDVEENAAKNDSESSLAKAKTNANAKTKAKKGIEGEVGLTTEKSGLILLHPFLTTFLKGADLVTEANEIKNVDKACMLLHYLATETEEVTDVELPLEKILLGIPMETIIDYQIPLTDEDKALCDELLQAVLEHWVALKKSTINTLRDMFLKRDGHIIITDESIKLKVEHLAQDILLDKVPWNIHLFRLKWMEKMVHVEW